MPSRGARRVSQSVGSRAADAACDETDAVALAAPPPGCYTLNQMVQYSRSPAFAALADATRRGVLEQLGRCDASISALAETFHMTLTGMKKHVGLLEEAGLVVTQKVGRVRTCRLGASRLDEEAAWIERYRLLWAARFDALDTVIADLKAREKKHGRRKR